MKGGQGDPCQGRGTKAGRSRPRTQECWTRTWRSARQAGRGFVGRRPAGPLLGSHIADLRYFSVCFGVVFCDRRTSFAPHRQLSRPQSLYLLLLSFN